MEKNNNNDIEIEATGNTVNTTNDRRKAIAYGAAGAAAAVTAAAGGYGMKKVYDRFRGDAAEAPAASAAGVRLFNSDDVDLL